MGLMSDYKCPVCNKVVYYGIKAKNNNGQLLYIIHPECAEIVKQKSNHTIPPWPTNVQEIKDILDGKIKRTCKEYRKRCNVCGRIFCYSDADIGKNIDTVMRAQREAKNARLNALAGTQVGYFANKISAEQRLNSVVDFSKCPYCNSSDLSDLSESDLNDPVKVEPRLENQQTQTSRRQYIEQPQKNPPAQVSQTRAVSKPVEKPKQQTPAETEPIKSASEAVIKKKEVKTPEPATASEMNQNKTGTSHAGKLLSGHTKKLFCFILQIIILIKLFTPNMFGLEHWKNDIYQGGAVLKSTEDLLFTRAMNLGAGFFIVGALTIGLAITCLVMFALTCFSQKKIPQKVQQLLFCLQAAAYAVFALMTVLYDHKVGDIWNHRGIAKSGLYIELVLYFIAAVLMFLKDKHISSRASTASTSANAPESKFESTRKLICFIIQIVVAVVLFMPNMFGAEIWKYDNQIVYHGAATRIQTDYCSFTEAMNSGEIPMILGFLTIGLVAACLVIFALSCFSQKHVTKKVQLSLLCVQAASFMAFALIYVLNSYESEYWRYKYIAGSMLYIELALYIALLAVAFLKDRKAAISTSANTSGLAEPESGQESDPSSAPKEFGRIDRMAKTNVAMPVYESRVAVANSKSERASTTEPAPEPAPLQQKESTQRPEPASEPAPLQQKASDERTEPAAEEAKPLTEEAELSRKSETQAIPSNEPPIASAAAVNPKNEQPASAQLPYGQQQPYPQTNPQYGQPSQYGQAPYGQYGQQLQYGQMPYGQQPQNGQYGQLPQYGQAPYGPYRQQPQYGQPPYGQYGQPAQNGQAPYGQPYPQNGQAPYGQPYPQNGQAPYGQPYPQYGQAPYGQPYPQYGQAPYGQPYVQEPVQSKRSKQPQKKFDWIKVVLIAVVILLAATLTVILVLNNCNGKQNNATQTGSSQAIESNQGPAKQNAAVNEPQSVPAAQPVEYPNGTIPLDSGTFPDSTFLKWINTNVAHANAAYLTAAEAAKVERIDCSGIGIVNLKGIENFPELRELKCSDNQIKSLDITANTKLWSIECYNNQIETVNLAYCPHLTKFDAWNNALTALDIRNNRELTYLNCDFNSITALDPSNCPLLETLMLAGNKLTSLDASMLTHLSTLSAGTNNLIELKLPNTGSLNTLYCDLNKLTALDISSHRNLNLCIADNNRFAMLVLPSSMPVDSNNNELFRIDTAEVTVSSLHVERDERGAYIDLTALVASSYFNRVHVTTPGATGPDANGKVYFTNVPTALTYTFDTGFNGYYLNVRVPLT